jgi:uncharacterized protein (TIGR02597 family)
MNRKPIAMAAALLLSLAVGSASRAADVSGFNKVVVPPGSDAVVTVPFVRASVAQLTATGATGTGITVTAPLPATDAYATVFYVRMTSGAALGRWRTISGNSAGELTLSDTSFVSSIANGDTFDIVPHQTLGSVFPDELKGISFLESSNTTIHSTEIWLPDTTTLSVNKAANTAYFFHQGNWKKSGSPYPISNNVILPPDLYIKLRNKSTTASLTFIVSGKTTSNADQSRVVRTETVKYDVPAGSGFATSISLRDLKLGGTSAFTTSTSTTLHKDELLVYVNGITGINNAPSMTFFYYNDAWRKSGEAGLSYPSHDIDLLPAGAALIIRKASAATPADNTWTEPKSE